jgi:hypothetical protein
MFRPAVDRSSPGSAPPRAQPSIGIWPSLPPDVRLRRARLPFPLHEPGCRLYRRSRQALFAGVRAHGLGPSDVILVPAYHHGSEVEALVRAGIGCRFYDVTTGLEPDPAALEHLLTDDVRALYLIDYFGFPQNAGWWRQWCDERELLLIEDASQAWLSEHDGVPVGAAADIAVYCLYKKYALPGGAALISTRPPPSTPPGSSDLVPLARASAGWLRDRLRPPHSTGGQDDEPFDAQLDFELGNPDDAPGRAARRVLPHLDPAAGARRSDNLRTLEDALRDLVPPACRRPAKGVVPFVLPVTSEAKTSVCAWLARSGVEALNIWSVPHPSLPVQAYPMAAQLRRTLLGLPVHQHLRAAQLQHIATATREAAWRAQRAAARLP